MGGISLPLWMVLVATLSKTLKNSGRDRKRQEENTSSIRAIFFGVYMLSFSWNKLTIATIIHVSQAKEDTACISYILKCTFLPHVVTSLKLGNTLFYSESVVPFLLTGT